MWQKNQKPMGSTKLYYSTVMFYIIFHINSGEKITAATNAKFRQKLLIKLCIRVLNLAWLLWGCEWRDAGTVHTFVKTYVYDLKLASLRTAALTTIFCKITFNQTNRIHKNWRGIWGMDWIEVKTGTVTTKFCSLFRVSSSSLPIQH
jgi:hypothetical protein